MEMEYCIEARALKPSLRREFVVRTGYSQAAAAFKVANKVSVEDEVESNCGGFVDDFLIDDLLDFPEKETELEEEEEEEEEKYSVSDGSVELELDENGNSTVSEQFDAGLAVPQDDLAELEWVSRFVDDTMPEFPQLYPAGKEYSNELNRKPSGAGSFPVQLKQNYQMMMVPAKPRTKRLRLGRLWSVGSSAGSESSTNTSSTLSSSSIISTPVQFGYNKPVMKKQRIEPKGVPVQFGGELDVRKCNHCGVQKTPQWRAGPEGAKTLCNACGVRFKSGRLYPEYRPACSPTFREEVHSNSHRKVLEIRKRKEC